jgi:glycerate dehydrogenase
MLCERLDGRTRILLKKQGVYDIMSVSEPEACLHGYGERRMSIMIAAKAASSTEGANHDILNLSFAMQVQMKMLACGNHDNFTRKYNSY